MNKFTEIGNINIKLLNGLDVLPNKNIILVGGLECKVMLYDNKFNLIKEIGGVGYSKSNFREPVGVFIDKSFGGCVGVTDWHNHRVVFYDENLNYKYEVGMPDFSHGNPGVFKKIYRFYKFINNKGVYIKSHFDGGDIETHKKTNIKINVIDIIRYWIELNNKSLKKSICNIIKSRNGMSKPNGVAFSENNIYISQKYKKSIHVYSAKNMPPEYIKEINAINNYKFGKLGNLHWSNNKLYICDEQNSRIVITDASFSWCDYIECGNNSGEGFLPFACCGICNNLLAVCGLNKLAIFNLETKKIIKTLTLPGEIHAVSCGVYEENGGLYLADRKYGKVYFVPNCNWTEAL